MDICQVEREGKGMASRGNSLGKGTEASCRAQSGSTAAAGRGQVMKVLPARLRSWDVVLGEWGAMEGFKQGNDLPEFA